MSALHSNTSSPVTNIGRARIEEIDPAKKYIGVLGQITYMYIHSHFHKYLKCCKQRIIKYLATVSAIPMGFISTRSLEAPVSVKIWPTVYASLLLAKLNDYNFEFECLFPHMYKSTCLHFVAGVWWPFFILLGPMTSSVVSYYLGSFLLSVCPGLITFCIFICYVLIGVSLQGLVESCLLSKDELLTPNTKIGENWTSRF